MRRAGSRQRRGLAVGGQVEKRPVAKTPFSVEPEPNRPNRLRLECRLCANHASGVPRLPFPDCRVERRVSHFGLLVAGLAMGRVRTLPSSEEGAKALPAKERVERGLAALTDCRGDPDGDNLQAAPLRQCAIMPRRCARHRRVGRAGTRDSVRGNDTK